ncbi:hypothetical protein [Brevibacillus sp. FIR094]|uniref:hypothetical protein n=1 Tax=Brevibacillus sp. FIR094 TaxID=3134809 RepID=UPI003D1EEAAA
MVRGSLNDERTGLVGKYIRSATVEPSGSRLSNARIIERGGGRGTGVLVPS